MSAGVLLAWFACTAGSAMCLSGVPFFRRTRLVDRLGPYSRVGASLRARPTAGAAGIRHVVVPGLERWISRVGTGLGVQSDLELRLERAGRPIDASGFRLRQVAHASIVLVVATAVVAAVRPPLVVGLAALVGAPTLAVLLDEHRLTAATKARQQRLLGELPVVAEQLGLLLAAGSSLPSAVSRLASRSDGTVATDLRQVTRRIRQGVTASEALAEWARRSGVDAIDRLVAVLRLHDDAGDLGALIAEEARSIRAAAHRDLLETIERRAQLVWIPVTVATLVPGLIFLAVPFLSAMEQVTGG